MQKWEALRNDFGLIRSLYTIMKTAVSHILQLKPSIMTVLCKQQNKSKPGNLRTARCGSDIC